MQPYGLQPTRLLCARNSPGKNTREGCHGGWGSSQPRSRTTSCKSSALTGGFFTNSATWEDFLNTHTVITKMKSIDLPRDWGFPGSTRGKEPTLQCKRLKRCRPDPWVRKISQSRAWQPTPVFLPGESHRQRSLAVHSPWGRTELDTTEVT